MLPKGYGLLKIRLSTLRLPVPESLAVKFWCVDGVSVGGCPMVRLRNRNVEKGNRSQSVLVGLQRWRTLHVTLQNGLRSFCNEKIIKDVCMYVCTYHSPENKQSYFRANLFVNWDDEIFLKCNFRRQTERT